MTTATGVPAQYFDGLRRRATACWWWSRWADGYADCAASAWRIVLGSMKRTSSWTTSNSATSCDAALAEEVDEALDELLGRAGARRDADDALALEPRLAGPAPALSIRCASAP